MSFIDDVRAKRQKLADVLSDEDYSGIREIVEELYPDRAHFIYELLQNTEDAGASEANFVLSDDTLRFEHNGQPFSEDDVWGITNIGKGNKKDQPDKIGRFGVGFKAIFAYCETPHIWSPTFSFKISELVLPTELKPKSGLGKKTYFEFPFNNPKKIARVAYEEIKSGLEELAETTLLFLSGINSIRWQIEQQPVGEVLRIKHSEHHIEVQKRVGGKTTSSSHFLRFSDAVDDLDKHCVAIAFELDFLPNISAFDAKKPLDKQLKIIPANPGRVAVFFPAEKETSGLRFHLHAPFVPELSRASIKDTPVNEPLFKQLAGLAASSMYKVRDLKLLTGDFLGVLPNSRDIIPERYQRIFNAIIVEMNGKPLTPTHAKKHEPAKHLIQARARLKSILSEEDLEFLVDYHEDPVKWAIGAQQKNSNVDHFLNDLLIQEWDVEGFVQLLEDKASETSRVPGNNSKHMHITDTEFMAWFAKKSDEWHQELYALLSSEYLIGQDHLQRQAIERLKPLKIVRLSNGGYSTGSKCYFPSDGTEQDELLPRVAIGVYSSGTSEGKKEDARKFLENIGVRQVGEFEQVEAILKKRYTTESFNPNINDIKQFISFVEKELQQVKLFASYCIFLRTDGKWGKPSAVFLDDPFLTTGLSAYYDALGNDAHKMPLALSYLECGVSVEKITKFAKAAGVQTQLEITTTNCNENPQKSYLVSVGGKYMNTSINRDYIITGLSKILAKPSIPISKLIWKNMCALPRSPNYLSAIYQKNSSHGAHFADSQLVHHLKNAAWVPQTNNTFVTPPKAARELLPEGFSFDAGQEWLKKICFGGNIEEQKNKLRQQSEDQQRKQAAAMDLGFSDPKSLEDAKWFAGLSEGERQRFKAEYQSRLATDLPDQEPANREQRNHKVGEQAADAPERLTEKRPRSVSIGREDVKKEAEPYLLQQYKNGDEPMICQVCKMPMPFKLEDGSDYFETVEFLQELKKRHYQNYLALCPNHSAMFQLANGSRDKLKDKFIEIDRNEIEVVLAQKDTTIYFTKTHIADLKTVIKVDLQEDEQECQP